MKLKAISLWVLPAALAVLAAPAVAARQASKTVYVSFVDADGKPLTDLKPEEIHLAENGKELPITSAKRITTPISVMMLADTTKVAGGGGFSASSSSAGELIRDIRSAFSAFTTDMLAADPANELGLMEFGQASITITDFTSSQQEIEKGITHLVPKPNADSVLLEAIQESSKDLEKRKNTRRAIVSINVEPGTELSKEPPNNIMKELGKAQAPLFSVSLQKGDNRNTQRGVVLPQLTKQTGGRHETIVGQSALVQLLKNIAATLNAQYEVTYTRPAGPTPQVLAMGVARNGVTILVTHFPPQ